jgi:hypothetical protein
MNAAHLVTQHKQRGSNRRPLRPNCGVMSHERCHRCIDRDVVDCRICTLRRRPNRLMPHSATTAGQFSSHFHSLKPTAEALRISATLEHGSRKTRDRARA